MAKTTTHRVGTVRSVTLNPEGVAKLLEVGATRAVPESSLSRLIDEAIAAYVAQHWKSDVSREVEAIDAVRRLEHAQTGLGPPPQRRPTPQRQQTPQGVKGLRKPPRERNKGKGK